MKLQYSLSFGASASTGPTIWKIDVADEVATIQCPDGVTLEIPAAGTITQVAQAIQEVCPGAFEIRGTGIVNITCSPEFVEVLPLVLRTIDRPFDWIEWEPDDESSMVLVNEEEWWPLTESFIYPFTGYGLEWDVHKLQSPSWAQIGISGIWTPEDFLGSIGRLNSLLGIEIFTAVESETYFRIFPIEDPVQHLLDFVSDGLYLDTMALFSDFADHPRGARAIEWALIDTLENPKMLEEDKEKSWSRFYRYLMPADWATRVNPALMDNPWPEEWILNPPADEVMRQDFLTRLKERNPDYSLEFPTSQT